MAKWQLRSKLGGVVTTLENTSTILKLENNILRLENC